MKKFFFTFLFFLIICFSFSQNHKKAMTFYNKASELYRKGNDEKAVKKLKEIIKKDSTFIPSYILLAKIYMKHNNVNASINMYEKAARIDDNPSLYINLAFLEMNAERFQDAKKNIEKAKKYKIYEKEIKEVLYDLDNKINFRIKAKNNPVPFVPVNLGKNINTRNSEYLPTITADEKTLIITVSIQKKEIRNENESKFQEDFFISHKLEDGSWSRIKNMGNKINTQNNEGAQSISADGQYLFFTACGRRDGKGSCDIYISKKNGDVWGKAQNIGAPINTHYWESQPSISSDGKTLYFASTRPDGIGKMDIWKSVSLGNGKWSYPKNLGRNINTKGDDYSPFIHTDNQTFYFTSDSWIGMGGSDIFLSRKNIKGFWEAPINLGYPINTPKDESSLIVNAKGDKAYFSTSREDGFGQMDIYSFDLYEEARPILVTYVKGKVFDAKDKKVLKARFELIDLESSKIIVESNSNPGNGEFLVPLVKSRNYALNVSKKGYLFYSENFSLKNLKDSEKIFLMDIPMQKIERNKKIILNNIFFDENSAILKKTSNVELNKLLKFMKKNPDLKIQISGHTDNIGEENDNQILSEERAKSVRDFLIKRKINENRISHIGYGEKKEITTNKTKEGRQKNRRTEIEILE